MRTSVRSVAGVPLFGSICTKSLTGTAREFHENIIGAAGDIDLTVLGPLARLETDTRRINLLAKDAQGTFEVDGADAAGYAAPIDPADVRLTYDKAALEVTPTGDGAFTVTAKLDPSRFTIKTAPARCAKLGDPLAPVLQGRIDVAATLRRLEHRASAGR